MPYINDDSINILSSVHFSVNLHFSYRRKGSVLCKCIYILFQSLQFQTIVIQAVHTSINIFMTVRVGIIYHTHFHIKV